MNYLMSTLSGEFIIRVHIVTNNQKPIQFSTSSFGLDTRIALLLL